MNKPSDNVVHYFDKKGSSLNAREQARTDTEARLTVALIGNRTEFVTQTMKDAFKEGCTFEDVVTIAFLSGGQAMLNVMNSVNNAWNWSGLKPPAEDKDNGQT